MNTKITKKLDKLNEAINETTNPDLTRLQVFVGLLDNIGITPKFIIEDVTNNVLGVALEVRSGEEKTTSLPIQTEIFLRAVA